MEREFEGGKGKKSMLERVSEGRRKSDKDFGVRNA